MHYYITKYEENGKRWAEAWVQINIFGWHICFCHKRIAI